AGRAGARPRRLGRARRDEAPRLRRRRVGRAARRARRRRQLVHARHRRRRPRHPPPPNGPPMIVSAQQLGGSQTPVQLLVLITLISLLPGALLATTGFTRILIVLGFVRNALGTPTMPPNQVLVGIAFFLSLFVMSPTLTKVNNQAIKPYRAGKISQEAALERGLEPVRTLMFKQTRTSA